MKLNGYENKNNIIGNNLKRIRKELGLTQESIAEKMQLLGVDCSRLTILRIENNGRLATDYEVKLLCKILNVSYEELLGQQDD